MKFLQHLAIIMDGNGRWAEQKALPRVVGHHRGAKTIKDIIDECSSLGIPYLTVYAFSSENWGRPQDEVNALMGILVQYLQGELERMKTRKIRLNVIGEISRLPEAALATLKQTLAETADNTGMVLTIALSYGARNELLRSVRSIAEDVRAGKLLPEDIDEKTISCALDTQDMPDPDLLIRTSGETRISNFLLWQIAYTELYFTDTLWPDFNVDELHKALSEYAGRQRRFGLTSEQMKKITEQSREDSH